MEFLSEPIYSVYSLCNKGKTLKNIVQHREWGNASQTFRGEVVNYKKAQDAAKKICKLF